MIRNNLLHRFFYIKSKPGLISDDLLPNFGTLMSVRDYPFDGNPGLSFVINNISYTVFEDPDDGYRSYAGEVYKNLDTDIYHHIWPVFTEVIKVSVKSDYQSYIEYEDMKTRETVIRFGTDYSDNYYPICMMSFNPESLSFNKGR